MENGLIMQYFEWYLPKKYDLWEKVYKEAENLSKLGITAVWLPPAYKGNEGDNDVGYAVYDLYDLGEFNQKGSIRTKYGTKDDYIKAIKELKKYNIDTFADISMDHKIGADAVEEIKVSEEEKCNRYHDITGEETILAWTKFTFPGRNNKYSDFKWDKNHFDGVDYDERSKRSSIFKFEGKEWNGSVDGEFGNYDYLMGADLDLENEEVIEELKKWGKWYVDLTGVDGFRIDAAKHISYVFTVKWLEYLRETMKKELFCVSEYWSPNIDILCNYINVTQGKMSLFDVPLHYNFQNASRSNGNYDMRNILKDTLVERNSVKAVTFVDNHDTEPGQSLESWVQWWFKPLAYSLILLREGGYPCVFYGDYYGILEKDQSPLKHILDILMKVRKKLSYGKQNDYFDCQDIIGWTREGDLEHKNSGIAVIMSIKNNGSKRMYIGKQFINKVFKDRLGNINEDIVIDNEGYGIFKVKSG